MNLIDSNPEYFDHVFGLRSDEGVDFWQELQHFERLHIRGVLDRNWFPLELLESPFSQIIDRLIYHSEPALS